MALLPSLDIVLFLSPENQRRGARAANLLLPVPGGEEGGPPLAMENQSVTSFCRCSVFSLAFMWPDLLHCERGGCREERRDPPPTPWPPAACPPARPSRRPASDRRAVIVLLLPPIPLAAGGLARSKTGDASSYYPCHWIHRVAKVKSHPVCALVSSGVQMGIMIPFKIPHWMIVRIK